VDYPNVSPIFGAIIINRLATLYELQTVYSLEDVFDFYEILYVKSINEEISYEEAKRKR
jgi:hypothetical protein